MTAPTAAQGSPRSRDLDVAEREAWQRAQALWGVHLHPARMYPGGGRRRGAPAWFSFPPSIGVDPTLVAALGGGAGLESVFAHELGHHVLAPSTRIDSLKIRHQMGRALLAAGAEQAGDADLALLSNLWTDLLVNTRVATLQRIRGPAGEEPGIVRLCRALYGASRGHADPLWWVYCRVYELIWQLVPGTLCTPAPPPPPDAGPPDRGDGPDDDLRRVPERFREQERALRRARRDAADVEAELLRITVTDPQADAVLISRTVRTFAADPVGGSITFGVIAAPYVVQRERRARRAASRGLPGGRGRRFGHRLGGRRGAAGGPAMPGPCAADGAPVSAAELGKILADRRLRGAVPPHPGTRTGVGEGTVDGAAGRRPDQGQALDAAQTLALYPPGLAEDVLTAWYRTTAAPWVRPYVRIAPRPADELPGPLEIWEPGDDLASLDWAVTMQRGPVIPGVTTRRHSQLPDDADPAASHLDVDLYIDSSGSMPAPRTGSPAVLAGAVLALSVLRGGGRLRVTSFSGRGQVAGLDRFSRDIAAIIRAIMTYFGSATSFPLDRYAERYLHLPDATAALQRHVVVLSDDGLVSMFGAGNEQYAGVAAAARRKLTTATLLLMDARHAVADLAAAAGYDVIYLSTMDDAPRACARLAEVLHG